MLRRLFGPRARVAVLVMAVTGGQVVRYSGEVSVPAPATVRTVLQQAGRKAGRDLLAALAAGEQPVCLVDGVRHDLPAGLDETVPDGAQVSWLMPMTGG